MLEHILNVSNGIKNNCKRQNANDARATLDTADVGDADDKRREPNSVILCRFPNKLIWVYGT